MKILVLCNHGNVRSVALKYLIQRLYDHDVLAAGVEENSFDTLEMLFKWAEKVISLTPEANDSVIASSHSPKDRHFIDIGKDVWNNPFAQELQHKLLKKVKELDL